MPERREEVIITIDDMRAIGYCCKGGREWFARHGLDWRKFRTEGLPANVIEATGDAMAIRLVEWVRNGR